MKLIDIVKRVEATGLDVKLTSDKHGNLFLHGWTNRPWTWAGEHVFGCMLEGENNDTASTWDEAFVTEELAKAAMHPDAVWRREMDAKLHADERSRNAA